jgi:hypothetical protein
MTTGNLFIVVLLIFFSHESSTAVPVEDGCGLVIGAKVTVLRLPQKITNVIAGARPCTLAINPRP